MKESTLVRRVDRMFQGQGLRVRREVPVGPKRIDLVALNPRSRQVTAVEAKVEDWRAGLRQAMIYRICADLVYVAVDDRFINRLDFDLLQQYGIGSIAVNGSAQVIRRAKPSTIIHRSLLERVRGYLEGEPMAEESRFGRS